MKKLFLILLTALIIPGCGLLEWTCGKTVKTAQEMAEETVFNADKHVWTYEQFKSNYAQFQQYMLQYKKARKEMDKIEALGIPDKMRDRYGSLTMELDGSRNMMARISAEYNKMSAVGYQKIWKNTPIDGGGILPERLDMPE